MQQKTRQYTADFFCFARNEDRSHKFLLNYLTKYLNGHAPAIELEDKAEEKYQIRSITATKNLNVFMAVFGRCRYNQTPEQTTEHGDDSDVELKPGHGLVEKNHFLYFADSNLVVFQRNGNASRYTHLQRYLNRPTYAGNLLIPVLTRDSYQRLEEGGEIKKAEISLFKPKYTFAPEEKFAGEIINLFGTAGAESMKITITAKRDRALLEVLRTDIPKLARIGRARIARIVMKEDNEIIDLIADRISQPMQVELGENGRPLPRSVFEALATAKDQRSTDLETFFG